MADSLSMDGPRRGVGTKAGIGREAIIEAARRLPPERLTMQAVADELGVDRSAINHHVKGREQLLRLVAVASFREGFSEIDLTGTWQQLSHRYARSYVQALLTVGPLAEHIDVGAQMEYGIRASEAVLRSLTEAGLPDETALRFLVLLGYIARSHALDRIGLEHGAEATRPETTQRLLREFGREEFPILDRVSAHPFNTYGDTQLTTAVDIAIAGVATLLSVENSDPHSN